MEVNPAAALAIQVTKGILSMGWTFWSVGHVKRSHSRGPPPVTIKTCLLGVLKCQLENRQFRLFWDGARGCWTRLPPFPGSGGPVRRRVRVAVPGGRARSERAAPLRGFRPEL